MELIDAQEKLSNEQLDFKLKYCPVFKSLCKGEQCHGYYKGAVTKNSNSFSIATPFCLSPLVTGEIITTEN